MSSLDETSTTPSEFDWSNLREKLAGKSGREYWKSLDEIADTDEFKRCLENEFPSQVEKWTLPVTRRQLLKYMAASFALAGLNACTRQPTEKIFSYNRSPEDMIPGKPLHFATGIRQRGATFGVLAESHMGRPTKLDGNPGHPDSLGAASANVQASVLNLYDPDRSQHVLHANTRSSWDAFLDEARQWRGQWMADQGAGLRLLTESIDSPTMNHQIQLFLSRYPKAEWHRFDPFERDEERSALKSLFGKGLRPLHQFDKAEVIVSFESDFLFDDPRAVRNARDFASGRKLTGRATRMNRLHAAEAFPSLTGGMADNRLRIKSTDIPALALALANKLGVSSPATPPRLSEQAERWVASATDDLKNAAGRSLVVAGSAQPASVHALCHALNFQLRNIGRTLTYVPPLDTHPDASLDSLSKLARDIERGEVKTLVILDSNIVHLAPADFDFASLLGRVEITIHLGIHHDETAEKALWHIPGTHELESWSDGRAMDGTVTFLQPLIHPLFDGKTGHDVLSALIEDTPRSSHAIVQSYWKVRWGALNFDARWKTAVHDGISPDTAFAPVPVSFSANWPGLFPASFPDSDEPELNIRLDPHIEDGRSANNAWLQETPKPVTKLTWDTAAHISPASAEQWGLQSGNKVEISVGDAAVVAPVLVVPGAADGSVTVHLGHGRTRAGRVGTGVGFNANRLRTTKNFREARVGLKKIKGRWPLAITQTHHSMEGRGLIQEASLENYRSNPAFAQAIHHEAQPHAASATLKKSEDYAWGMAIDLNACNGCNACLVACQAENNIPVVGKEEVRKGREMHWIRVDHYYQGPLDDPSYAHQPVPCMHCENAPCEPVCPVAATSHSDEGLNEQTYNRCIGTRYCSNNCPYKVRRFNFYQYTDKKTELLKMQRNLDVTVRTRGVMEKCTYCVQRINSARIEAHRDGEKIEDGQVVTACQSTCPAQAIVFGNLLDPNSRVSQMKKDPRNYGILTSLNTAPRTTYLAKVRNPKPETA